MNATAAVEMIASWWLTNAAIGFGGVKEFVYYGPGTPEFATGVVATLAGILAIASGIVLWRQCLRARRFVIAAGVIMLAVTIVATGLGVMGPQATLMGGIGGFAPLIWAWRHRATIV